MTTAISHLTVIGVDMNCPLCKQLIRSGQSHSCTVENGVVKSTLTTPPITPPTTIEITRALAPGKPRKLR